MNYLPGTAWLAVHGFRQNLSNELSLNSGFSLKKVQEYGDIVYCEIPGIQTFWHRTVLEKPFTVQFSSISEAAGLLRSVQRNWAYYPLNCFRRGELIREKLPYINEKPRKFPYHVPDAPMGLWTLLDEHTIFASAETSSPFPGGEIYFEEDHVNPPSRAYLKMYEALAWVQYLAGEGSLPGPGSSCIDAGASPGGWTWVLNKLGAGVTAIDRAELAPELMAKKEISFIKHDAFTLKPEDLGPRDWICSDVICYPPRLLEWIQKWIESGLCGNFICTLKMQGAADHSTTREFAAIPGSRVVHLTANKNELTFIRLAALI
ncbi:SAM-dependent methyltransferase [Brucepastera parasyntrophica]|uniref:SAM-dependent methyltransferase n=1 Tax=Brucepastera parasyntrophica TaxID=2880008 RepID=UPI0021089197|nr:SAM-dependent methyltransferase [Brucepastera parasyntrophica]ULQ59289.1 SAM-dependent methyltransferase [Brucepastera parasyntrophica]